MSEYPWKLLKTFIWPRYCEEGPPKYIDIAFFNKDLIDDYGKIKEPVKSVIELIVLGYRPVTSLSILAVLVENRNKPMYGSQLGAMLEKHFQLPKGWFTKTRYYDNRIGKLLKILTRLNILEETKVKDWRTNKEYIGYCIAKDIYPIINDKVSAFLNGQGLSVLSSPISRKILEEKATITKHCPRCKNITTSITAKYCEVCGAPLKAKCPNCQKEISLEYSFCIYCGKALI
ncbi:MAG: zinc ribbon domain-containing protein [Candidatus Bathyarchaeia archaeon]